jgi:hypothetical protein
MLDELKEVSVVQVEGFFDFRHIDPSEYEKTREDFHKKHGRPLPFMGELKKMGTPRDLRLLLTPLTITILFESSEWWQYKFHPGFITDLSSVPSFFRSFVDNDDVDMLAACLCHDVNFSMHHIPFVETNELFYKMVMARDGMPGTNDHWISLPTRAKLAWLAIRSFVGRMKWKGNKARREWWTNKTTEFMKAR